MDWEKKIHGINQSCLLFLHEFRKSSTLTKVASERLRLTQWVHPPPGLVQEAWESHYTRTVHTGHAERIVHPLCGHVRGSSPDRGTASPLVVIR